MEGKKLKKSIITVLGKDSVGIIAKVCTYLANNNVTLTRQLPAVSST